MKRTVTQQIGIIGRDRAVLIVIGEGNETAQRQQSERIGDSPTLSLDQSGAKTDGKAANADPLHRGRQKMSCFMNNDEQSEHQKGGQYVHTAFSKPFRSFWLESIAADVRHQNIGE